MAKKSKQKLMVIDTISGLDRERVKVTSDAAVPDRITVSMDRAVKHYGAGFSVFASYATSLASGEDPQSGMARAQKEVKKFVDEAVAKELEAQTNGG